MTIRSCLVAIWVIALITALVVVEGYFWRRDASGVSFLLPSDRGAVYPTFIAIFSATVGPILLALFLRPFRPPMKQNRRSAIGVFALVLTAFYNTILIYIIAQGHWQQSITIDEILAQARQAAFILAFLIVPVNAYYFGLKVAPGTEGESAA